MSNSRVLTALGFMAGTSLDGVDAAIVRTDGEGLVEVGPNLHLPYEATTRAMVVRATKAALEGRDSADDITQAVDMVTSAHINAAQKLMEKHHLQRTEIDIIGFHGQTILHRPAKARDQRGRSWQIGSGAIVAQELKIDVIDDFRKQDIEAGGEGAPFSPVYHQALVRAQNPEGAVCVLNIGGVANVTYVPENGQINEMIAFDSGPGNGLIDEWLVLSTGAPMDEDGALAASGIVDETALRMLMLSPYLKRNPPKSLDRYDFKLNPIKHLSPADGAATLTAFTAETVRASVVFLPQPPIGWVVCGGGRHNPVLMDALANRLGAPVKKAEDVGWNGDFIEAECFAYLAVRSLKKLPLSFPKTTRVPHPKCGGTYHKGRA